MIRTEDYKRELVSILFAQKHLIFWTAFLIFVGAVWIAFYWPPTYSATGTVLVKSKQPVKSPEALQDRVPRRFVDLSKEDLASEAELIKSPEVVANATRHLGAKYPSYTEGSERGQGPSEAVYRILRNLKTEVVPLSNVISIVYYGADPEEAVDTLNTLMEEYIVQRGKIYNTGRSGSFFKDQAGRFRNDLEEKERELLQLIEESGVSDPEKELNNSIALKQSMENELTLLRSQYLDKKADLENLQQALASEDIQYFSYIDSFVIVELGKKLTELYMERGKLLRIYLPDSEMVQTVTLQIDDTYDTLKAEATAYMNSLSKQLEAMEEKIRIAETAIARYDEQSLELGKQILETTRIEREARLSNFSYETYAKRAEEELIDNSLNESGITTSVSILNRAFPSNGPVFPKPGVVIPLGLLIGLITGCSLGLLREYFDHTFKRPSDVLTYTGLPVLFSIGKPESKGGKALYTIIVLLAVGFMVFFIFKRLMPGDVTFYR